VAGGAPRRTLLGHPLVRQKQRRNACTPQTTGGTSTRRWDALRSARFASRRKRRSQQTTTYGCLHARCRQHTGPIVITSCAHNSCWDTKGFRLCNDFGEKRATAYLTDAMMLQDKDDFSNSD
jgi:hypothetical protein